MNRILVYIIFVCSVAMGLILFAIGMADPVANAGGLPHPDIPGAAIGGDGAARLASIGVLAFTFQCLLLLMVVCLAALGVSERHHDGLFFAMMLGTLAFSLLVWWRMYSGHQEFLDTGTVGYFIGFPIPTAWQVYGTWLGALPLIVLYSWGFRRYIYTPEDEAAFKQLLAEQQEQ